VSDTPGDVLPAALSRPYRYIRLSWTQEVRMLRVSMNVRPIQCYSLSVMDELQRVFDDIADNPGLVRHYAVTSDVPGVFNFGGDLALFVLLVRARDVESLQLYGRRCVDLVWWVDQAFKHGLTTTVLAQGDTLGGGLESVLPFDNVIFERSAQAGFPEVLFNLFPGMGAWQFTARRAGMQVADEMVMSGRLYNADELQQRGLVDFVVADGEGEAALEAVVRLLDRNEREGLARAPRRDLSRAAQPIAHHVPDDEEHPRYRGIHAAVTGRSMAFPLSYDSLIRVVDHWAETALTLTDRDLRLMERLARAQMRKVGGADEGAVEEIKRLELDTAWGEERTGISQWAPLTGF
jgi:DSF synthase